MCLQWSVKIPSWIYGIEEDFLHVILNFLEISNLISNNFFINSVNSGNKLGLFLNYIDNGKLICSLIVFFLFFFFSLKELKDLNDDAELIDAFIKNNSESVSVMFEDNMLILCYDNIVASLIFL